MDGCLHFCLIRKFHRAKTFHFSQCLLETYLNYDKYLAKYLTFEITYPCHSSCEAVAFYSILKKAHLYIFFVNPWCKMT